MNKGVIYAGVAYILWGLLPVYWKALQHVPALEILGHRMVWSLVVVLGLLLYRRHWRWLGAVLHQPNTLLTFVGSSVLITINWFVYIWAVNAGYIVETSLGYFINPLVNVCLGLIFLRERLRLWQGLAVAIALAGVLYLTISYGAVPWIALALAGTFGLYGLLRKTASLSALEGLTLETMMLFVPALAYLLYRQLIGSGAFGSDGVTTILLIGAGIVTAVPLLLFAAGARLITMSTLGVLQYIAPTLQFLLGVFIYHEPLTSVRLIGFCLIWAALAVYTVEGIVQGSRTARLRATA